MISRVGCKIIKVNGFQIRSTSTISKICPRTYLRICHKMFKNAIILSAYALKILNAYR